MMPSGNGSFSEDDSRRVFLGDSESAQQSNQDSRASIYVIRVPCKRGILEMRVTPSSKNDSTATDLTIQAPHTTGDVPMLNDHSSEPIAKELVIRCRAGVVKFVASKQSIGHAIEAGEIYTKFIPNKKAKNLQEVKACTVDLSVDGVSVNYDVLLQWCKCPLKNCDSESPGALVNYATQKLYKTEALTLQMRAKSFNDGDALTTTAPPSDKNDEKGTGSKKKDSDAKLPELVIPCRDGYVRFIASTESIRHVIESGRINTPFIRKNKNKAKDPQCIEACTVELPCEGGSISYELVLQCRERRPEIYDSESQQERLSAFNGLREALKQPTKQALFLRIVGGWMFLRPDENDLLEYISYGLITGVLWAGLLCCLFGYFWIGKTDPFWYASILVPTGLIVTAFIMKCAGAMLDGIPSLCYVIAEVFSAASFLFLVGLFVLALVLPLPHSQTTN